MQIKAIASILAVASIAAAAAPTSGVAHLKNADGVDAKFTFTAVADGIKIDVDAKGLTSALQKVPAGFAYHVHVKPVTNGDCMSTGLHLDPKNVGTAKPCNPQDQTTCETGDLSGKYGNIQGTADGVIAPISYVDKHLTFAGD
ncbi:hypothetical protein BGZ94_003926, partial [Podila epigama]